MKKFISILPLLFIPFLAVAQSGLNPISVNGNNVNLNAPDATPSSVNIVVPNSGGSYNIYTGGTKRKTISGSGTETFQTGANLAMAPYTVTMAATPVATTNAFAGIVNVVPTAAANTAALLPTTPDAGTIRVIMNTGPNAVRVKPGGTDTIQGGSAGAYIPLAALSNAICVASSTSNWTCHTGVVPTPAGP